MTVLSVGYPLFPVGPDASGGAEQILSLIDHALVEAGHRSIVVAAEGSEIVGELIPSPRSNGPLREDLRGEAQAAHLEVLNGALDAYEIDVVHFHGLDFRTYVPETSVPLIATLHLPIDWYPQSIFNLEDVRLVCVSKSQAHGARHIVIPNGVDTARYRPHAPKADFLLWLGRVCPEKGVHLALEVAHKLDLPLLVAGPVHAFPSHTEYFEGRVKPLLDDKRRYVGAVEGERKTELFASARCLVIPSLVAETSSLVAMEAISCGTPVVAFRSGALPEVVDDGKTGFVVDTPDQMAKAVLRSNEISADVCREIALSRFSAQRMTSDYLTLYSSVPGMTHA